ncbi:ribonuclease H-like domain-containing protein [Tanacetum coccineum]
MRVLRFHLILTFPREFRTTFRIPPNLDDEPFVFNQDPGENSSQSPPYIDHHCCYGCDDSLDGIFCQQCTCESCGNGAHYGYNCPPQAPIISNPEPCNNQTVDELPQTLLSFNPTCYSGDGSSFTYDSTPNFVDDSPNIPICYDDDDDEESSIPLRDIIISELPPCIAITPVLLTKEPADSLIMEDKHLDTIPATESDKDEVFDDIISIPPGNGNDHFNAESSLIESVLNRDNVIYSLKIDFFLEEFADIRFIKNLIYDNSFPLPPKTLKDDFETVIDSNNDYSSSDNDSLYSDDIDYVEASPPDSELISLEVVEILLTIKDVGNYGTAGRIYSREEKRKARTTCLLALSENHLLNSIRCDAKEMWDAQILDLKDSQRLAGPKSSVTIDGEGVDWTNHSEEDEDYALMACNSSDSDTEREQLSDASIEIKAYSQGLKKVEAQLVAHQQGQLCKLLNTQMSANDKFGLGYGDHRYDGILSYENEVLQSVFMNKESELEKQPLYDRFVTADGMHAVPPPMTGNYMPSGPDIEVDYSQFTYGPKQTQPSESESQSSEFDTCESNISTEPSELVSEPVVNESNVECQPKVWSDAPIIEEYESDSEDEYVSIPTKEQETPSFANQQVKTPRETQCFRVLLLSSPASILVSRIPCIPPPVILISLDSALSSKMPYCDFHEKRMTRKAESNNGWNNVQNVNKQNQFVPSTVLTRTGKIPVSTARASGTKNFSTARQSFSRQAVPTSTAMKVNTIKPIVNRVRPTNVFPKTHSPSSRPFKKTTVLRTNFSKQKVNTAKVNAVSIVRGKRETAVKPSDYPHRALKNKGIVDSGCSRHMTGNKAYLAEFQDFNGGPVAFGGSKGYITGKGKIKTGKLDFEDVCFVKELQHFNLFSVSQMCDKKNKVLFTDSECLVLSPEFKLPDENQVLLKIPRQNNMYSFNLENIVPSGGLACLIAKATTDESNKWHRRLGHVNFKNLNKLVKGNLVRGLPSKIFQNDHTCVACQKGKQHKASCKAKTVSSISHSLQLLHMDLFGPTSVRSEILSSMNLLRSFS